MARDFRGYRRRFGASWLASRSPDREAPVNVFGLTSWLEMVGAIVAIVATSLGIVATVGGWIKRSIGRMIDDKLDPVYRRLDEHMSAEDRSLAKIAEAMSKLADSWQGSED